jgi:hypothetical protein
MMLADANFTPIVVRVLANHAQALWFHFGTVRYDFRRFRFFNSLRARFVPVRFCRRRYGTVHPSTGGCTRTTPFTPDPYRRARTRVQETAQEWHRPHDRVPSRGAAGHGQ